MVTLRVSSVWNTDFDRLVMGISVNEEPSINMVSFLSRDANANCNDTVRNFSCHFNASNAITVTKAGSPVTINKLRNKMNSMIALPVLTSTVIFTCVLLS